MRLVLVILAATAFLAPLLASPSAARAEEHTISIGDRDFEPKEIKIRPGDTVTWVNDDDRDHTVVSDEDSEESFDSGKIRAGKSFSHTFEKAGTFEYHCKYVLRLKGKIIVKEEE